MFELIQEDIDNVFAKDPAARSTLEVLFLYPGLHALWLHRLAHALWRRRRLLLARLISHINRRITGIEIHPGASIGRRFFVDHGMGVVIGETAEIGDDVLMYQGVVLGGTSLKRRKRHPTIGSNVVIGAGAIVLGPISVGDGARIGAGSVIIKPVPADVTVVGVPGHVASSRRELTASEMLEHGHLPDPVLRALSRMLDNQNRLEERMHDLEGQLAAIRANGEGVAPTTSPASLRSSLTEVIEPEVGLNVMDLGLIRDVRVGPGGVEIHMAMTYPNCPQADYLVSQVRRKAQNASNGAPVKIVVVDAEAAASEADGGLPLNSQEVAQSQ